MSIAARAKALEAGWYESRRGRLALRTLHDAHLVNALLATLAARDPVAITRPLAAEVARRGLREAALAQAARRAR